MSFPNISDLAATTIENRSGKVADSVMNSNALLQELQKKGNVKPVSGGRLIYQELAFAANGNAGSYSGYDQLPVAQQDVISAAEFAIKQYACAVTISGLEEIQNAGKEQIIDLLESRVGVAEASMANLMATHAYADGTGNGGKNLTGLDLAVPQDPTQGTYGGISRVNWSFWRSKLYDPSSTPTATTIQQYMNNLWALCVRGKDHPDLIISGSTLWATYLASLQALQRFTDAKSAGSGFPSLDYMGGAAKVVLETADNTGVVATDMYFLNTDYLFFRPIKGRNMVALSPERRYAVNQDAVVQFLGWAGNITCSGGRFHGRLKGD